jgi:dynein heavy chain, axonemal
MCTITEASHKRLGRTQLYIPISEELHDLEAAAREKDQVQRLEAIVIYWTRQIKELVTNQDGQSSGDDSTPLDEIRHWNYRNGNLKNLMKTLQ